MKVRMIAMVLTLVALAACEREAAVRDEPESPQAQLMEDSLPSDAAAQADTVGAVTVVLEEWTIRPARDTLAGGGPTVFRVRNRGEYPHILEVEGQGSEWVTDTIPPGDWVLLETDLRPGTYELYCPIDGDHGDHSDLGMSTPLVVLENPDTTG